MDEAMRQKVIAHGEAYRADWEERKKGLDPETVERIEIFNAANEMEMENLERMNQEIKDSRARIDQLESRVAALEAKLG